MGSKEVYFSLQELFPQIDARALRAVAIEHSKDVDAAVMAVLEEIIPFTERFASSSPSTQSIFRSGSFLRNRALVGAIVGTQTEDCPSMDLVGSAELTNAYHVDNGEQPLGDSEDGPSEPYYDAYDGQRRVEDDIAELTLSEKTHGNKMKMSADMYSHGESVVFIDENRADTPQIALLGDTQTQETISGDKSSESGIKISSDSTPQGPQHTLKTSLEVDMGASERMNLLQEKDNTSGHLETDFGTACNEKNDMKKPFGEAVSWTDVDVTVRQAESIVQMVEVPDMLESNLGDSTACWFSDTASKPETMSKFVGTEDESTLNSTMSQSSQIHIIGTIEEIVADARNNKEILFLAMESIISLMRQVELKEQAAQQAKVEAAVGRMDILNKVEELTQMLQYAKEANNMLAGEVYGEKAILATELRELHFRVRSLSDERDKSIGVLDEMRQTLEVQLAAAENEIKSAEQEKLERKKAARKSLADLELAMEKVVQESKILKQQEEENVKLNDFLVDRGRVVDALQGEIAVICQDVRLLKEKFDIHVRFNKSPFSNQTSFILASSKSSSMSLVSDKVEALPLRDNDLLETQKNGGLEFVPEAEAESAETLNWSVKQKQHLMTVWHFKMTGGSFFD